MKKIPTIFKRNLEKLSQILNEPHPDCDWVFKGEGIATRKYDGTCCLIKRGQLYKRREVKKGKPIPDDFVEADYASITEKRVGWVPIVVAEDKWHWEALRNTGFLQDGAYELIGPKVQGNPEKCEHHILVPHRNTQQFPDVPTDFLQLGVWLKNKDIEGIVWHHRDGRMAKIKKKDFGLKRE